MSVCFNLGLDRPGPLAIYAGYVVLRACLRAKRAHQCALAIADPDRASRLGAKVGYVVYQYMPGGVRTHAHAHAHVGACARTHTCEHRLVISNNRSTLPVCTCHLFMSVRDFWYTRAGLVFTAPLKCVIV
jgi:hypothetical protein